MGGTYRGAASRSWSWCPPPRGHRDPHTSSSLCCCGTGWARTAHAHHTWGQTGQAAVDAVGPSPQGCVHALAGTGFSPPLQREVRGETISGMVCPQPWVPLHLAQDHQSCLLITGFCFTEFYECKTVLLFNGFSGQEDYIYIFSFLSNFFSFSKTEAKLT